MVQTRTEWWQAKFDRNVANDKRHARELRKLGWHVLTIWECELKKPEKVLPRLERLLTTEATESTKVIPYPTQEDTEMPQAAEKQAKYRIRK